MPEMLFLAAASVCLLGVQAQNAFGPPSPYPPPPSYNPPPPVYNPPPPVYNPPPPVYNPPPPVYNPPPPVYNPPPPVYYPPPPVYYPPPPVYYPPPTTTPYQFGCRNPLFCFLDILSDWIPRPGPTPRPTSSYVATNADMQASIANCATTCTTLSYGESDSGTYILLTQLSVALKSCQSLSYDQPTLVSLSPYISRMKAATAGAKSCQRTKLSARVVTNLSGNVMYWKNGGTNPSVDKVQNLLQTASQCLEQYC